MGALLCWIAEPGATQRGHLLLDHGAVCRERLAGHVVREHRVDPDYQTLALVRRLELVRTRRGCLDGRTCDDLASLRLDEYLALVGGGLGAPHTHRLELHGLADLRRTREGWLGLGHGCNPEPDLVASGRGVSEVAVVVLCTGGADDRLAVHRLRHLERRSVDAFTRLAVEQPSLIHVRPARVVRGHSDVALDGAVNDHLAGDADLDDRGLAARDRSGRLTGTNVADDPSVYEQVKRVGVARCQTGHQLVKRNRVTRHGVNRAVECVSVQLDRERSDDRVVVGVNTAVHAQLTVVAVEHRVGLRTLHRHVPVEQYRASRVPDLNGVRRIAVRREREAPVLRPRLQRHRIGLCVIVTLADDHDLNRVRTINRSANVEGSATRRSQRLKRDGRQISDRSRSSSTCRHDRRHKGEDHTKKRGKECPRSVSPHGDLQVVVVECEKLR